MGWTNISFYDENLSDPALMAAKGSLATYGVESATLERLRERFAG